MGSIKGNHLNVTSCNVRGLRNRNKCRALLQALTDNNIHVCLLQETYLTSECNEWLSELLHDDYVCVSSFGTNHARGVSILVKNVNEIEIISKRCDNEGRIIMIQLNVLDEIYTIMNVYAPNNDKDRLALFGKVEKWIKTYAGSSENCIVAGDFNTTPDPEKDRKAGVNLIDQSNKKFHCICKSLNLSDIWRYKNPNKVEYTCRAQSRIDLIICSKSIINTSTVEIKHPYVSSDHQIVHLSINVGKYPRGPGYWKLNCSILEDKCYVSEIKNLIQKFKEDHLKQGFSNMQLWEMCKNRIKEYTIKFCKKKQKTDKIEFTNIEKELSSVELMLKSNWSKQLESRKNYLVNSLETHYLKKAKAAQVRSRVQWVEQGEKNTKFFLGLEKHHQKHNMITSLKTSAKQLNDFDSILQEIVEFYTDLYSSKNIQESLMDEYLDKTNMENVLDEREIAICEGPLSIDECTETISKMKKNKSPGNDGLPVEFYQTFWNEIKHMVVNALNESYQNEAMSGSQRRAIITLIFKKGDPELLKNWRPISLLNTDYKIAAFGIANRLQTVLSKLISKDQTAYVKGRFIGTNIRLIEDIYEYTESYNLQGAILYCDFEKAFDTLEIPFVIKVLQKYKFGPQLQQWIKTFYTNIDACIKCNNWLSCPIKIHRGIRQGCPVSALLFILVAELMAINIRANKDINGIRLPDRDEDIKVSQVADDTTLFVRDITSIINVLEEIIINY